ncbi:amino acid permease [Patescibacteria group bacterium]|nr:amino acid permease [Patescibacteria group bacterium]
MTAFWKALTVFVSTIIGVGIFGLPWVAAKSGFFVLLGYFLILGTVAILVHLILGEIVVGTKEERRFPGYVKQYLGKRWGTVSFIAMCAGLFGAQLAYLVVGGGFLANILSPYLGGSVLIYVLFFFAIGSLLIYRGIKSICLTEFLILILFLGILVFFVVRALPYINPVNFLQVDLKYIFLPYGVIVFSLWGSAILPEVKEILGKRKKDLRKVIISGIIISAIVYLIFIIAIMGVSGQGTSEDAISGFGSIVGGNVSRIGFIFGLLTCFSSYLMLGLTLKKIFWYDMKMSEKTSWTVASFVPMAMFLFGAREFINIIGFTGALAGGVEGFTLIFLYRSFVKKKKVGKKMNPLYFLLAIFFVLGMVAEISHFFRG